MDAIKALIEGITQDLVTYLVDDRGISIEDAIAAVYSSSTFEKLTSSDTGLYRESPAYIYEFLKDELNEGRLVQKEI